MPRGPRRCRVPLGKMFRKKLIKRTLELVGAVAMVYLMLEILEAQTMQRPEKDRNVQRMVTPEESRQEQQQNVVEKIKVEEIKRQSPVEDKAPPPPPPKPVEKEKKPEPVLPASPKKKEKPESPRVIVKPAKVVKKPPPKEPKGPPAGGAGKGKGKAGPDLGVRTDFTNQDIPMPKLKSSGYVLPMLYFDMGPNNLFRLFRQGVVTAYEMGRSSVVPVFHRHPRMGDKAKNPFVLPIFDTNYTVDLVWPPMDTIDIGVLKKVVPTIGMREFQKVCKSKLDAIVKCGIFDQKRDDGIKHFRRAANLKFDKIIEVKTYEELVPNDLSAGVVGPDEHRCLGVVYGKKCLPDQDRWLATFSRISKSFKRPMAIRQFAQDFMETKMGNKQFMAVHWRYESDWLDMCKPSRPKGARERNKAICKMVMGLDFDEDIRKDFVQRLKDKMADYNLQKIYLASPPNNIELIRLLNASFPGNFYYAEDVLKYAEKKQGKAFLDNNYKASFVEQEICFKSTLYLGAALSSWTQTVLTDRLSRGIKRHDSVLQVVGNGAPGFPELVFQFPEGNFNFGGMIPGKKV
ncbi:uncharacterized protein LOC120330011 [Styela clava]|uniref:uncharacterized protein LOC120330011 n=1 Tax=Styela clava TaxID=7725 RepID=UPI00193993E9|nr:uncharacterized protein LOC120330011 [Styela clava]